MGLTLYCKGCKCYKDSDNMFDSVDIGYISFTMYRLGLCKAKSDRLGELYNKFISNSVMSSIELLEQEQKEMEQLAEGLIILLYHSDCDGVLLPSQSGAIYKAIQRVDYSFPLESYHNMNTDFHEVFKNMLYYSWKKRRRIRFE